MAGNCLCVMAMATCPIHIVSGKPPPKSSRRTTADKELCVSEQNTHDRPVHCRHRRHSANEMNTNGQHCNDNAYHIYAEGLIAVAESEVKQKPETRASERARKQRCKSQPFYNGGWWCCWLCSGLLLKTLCCVSRFFHARHVQRM